MSLSYSVIILSADDRLQHRLLQAMERVEMISDQKVFMDFEEIKKAGFGEEPTLCFADLRLLPSPAQIAQWLTAHPQVKLLILHPLAGEEKVLAYLQAGAMGHLAFDDMESEQVKQAVRTLLNDEAFLSPTIAGRILDAIAKRNPNPERKKEVQD